MHQSCGFHAFPWSVARRFLPWSLWNSLKSTTCEKIGKTTCRTNNGQNVHTRSPPSNDLVLSRHWVRRVAPALQKLTREMSTGVSPALENLFFEGPQLSGPVKSDLELFFAARQFSGCPRLSIGLVGNVLREFVIDERALLSVCLVFHVFYLYLALIVTHRFHHTCCSALGDCPLSRKMPYSLFQSKVKRDSLSLSDRATSILWVAPPTACYRSSLYS